MFKSLLDFSSYEILGAVAMIFFLAIFIGMIILVLRLKKSYIKQMENLPLQSDDDSTTAMKEQE
jgi:cbb3-type cytochrome oxidase subunit 3